ncbi:MAG: 4-(cytidine 5'-diphospho)-2-C-methyl-D-erythritol kinase [Lachnospiraceae bacterium]|nr:4-(cytidine 5'-diphospho)-2-C-methyl-D-erythritol kinase [Lachnospiraceae bacterium]
MTKVYARAKINLTLNVLGRRPNGYHDLELIFQPVSLCDELDIQANDRDELVFTCSDPEFQGEDNLVCRGYRAMKARFGDRIGGLTIHLDKRIPSGAGMAGGSTDCAALLVWMNQYYDLGLTCQMLIDIGVTLGADVPACMIPHATLGRGVGEILSDIHIHREYPLLLIKPRISLNTAEMFQALDEAYAAGEAVTVGGTGAAAAATESVDPAAGTSAIAAATESVNPAAETLAMVAAMETGDLAAMGQHLYNVFETVVPCKEQIAGYKRVLLEAGALGSLMTGSGSVVYGIFEKKEARDAAYRKLACLKGCELYVCDAVNLWDEKAESLQTE